MEMPSRPQNAGSLLTLERTPADPSGAGAGAGGMGAAVAAAAAAAPIAGGLALLNFSGPPPAANRPDILEDNNVAVPGLLLQPQEARAGAVPANNPTPSSTPQPSPGTLSEDRGDGYRLPPPLKSGRGNQSPRGGDSDSGSNSSLSS